MKKTTAFFRSVKLLIQDVPALFPVMLLSAALDAVYPYISVILSAKILTEITYEVKDMKHILLLAGLLVGLNFLGTLIKNLVGQTQDVLDYATMKTRIQAIADKSWTLDYAVIGDPAMRERIANMNRWIYGHGILKITSKVKSFIKTLFTFVISFSVLSGFFSTKAEGEGTMVSFINSPWYIVLFAVMFVIALVVGMYSTGKTNNVYHAAWGKMGKANNLFNKIVWKNVLDYTYGKDIRIFNAKNMLLGKLKEASGTILKVDCETVNRVTAIGFVNTLISGMFNTPVLYAMVGMKAYFGAFEVGNLFEYIGTIAILSSAVIEICNTMVGMQGEGKYLIEYLEFLDYKNASATGTRKLTEELAMQPADETKAVKVVGEEETKAVQVVGEEETPGRIKDYTIEVRNLTFTYPGCEEPTLKDISCTIRKGDKVAIVGRNGSGKSTFIKLLCRLYDPDSGEILINGVNIKEYELADYHKLYSTVFQDFFIYGLTLGENVAPVLGRKDGEVIKALEAAGFKDRLDTLPNGINTFVHSWFGVDGVEFSGGEEQKVAIARALYKNAPFAIFDEPTAALDPMAEADIYERMNTFVKDKSAIFISHRLSSCKFCDNIMVFDNGKLVENGSHTKLLEEKGLYETMWNAQAQYYL